MPPRTSQHLTEAQLNRLLILYGAGNSNRAIARQFGCSEGSVRNALLRYHRTGSTRQATSPGRPHLLSPEREERLRQLCRRRPRATAQAISYTARLMGIGCLSVLSRSVTHTSNRSLSSLSSRQRPATCRRTYLSLALSTSRPLVSYVSTQIT